MARTATGVVVEDTRRRSPTFGLRFQAYGRRRYVTLGSRDDGWDRAKAERELQHILADVERGKWQPSEREPVVGAARDAHVPRVRLGVVRAAEGRGRPPRSRTNRGRRRRP